MEVKFATNTQIAKMKKLALELQEFADKKGYTEEELVNTVMCMIGEYLGQMTPSMQQLCLMEIFLVAGLIKSPPFRLN